MNDNIIPFETQRDVFVPNYKGAFETLIKAFGVQVARYKRADGSIGIAVTAQRQGCDITEEEAATIFAAAQESFS